MGQNALISIVIPVYNAEKYLPKCLDSILDQTYSNLEVICVNDSSPDNSLEVLNRYAEKDSRFHVIDKENEGVSAARNAGLSEAFGEYVMFVDADDWIDAETCQIAVNAMTDYQADVILWSYVSENHGNQSFKKLFDGDTVFEEEMCKQRLHRRFVGIAGDELAHPELADALCPVWGKLYKREVIQKSGATFVDLSEIGTYEDGLFNLEVFGEVKKAVYLDRCMYHYRRDNIGSTTSKYNPHLFNRWQNLYNRIEEYIKNKNYPVLYDQALQNRRALGLLGLGLNIVEADFSAIKKVQLIQQILTDERYEAAYRKLDFHYFPIHWKVFYICAKYKLSVGIFIQLKVIISIIK